MDNKTEAEQLKSNYFKWHYENRDKIVPADIADYWLNKMSEQKAKMLEELKKKWNCHQIGCDWNRNMVYGNKTCDMNCNNVLEIINKQ